MAIETGELFTWGKAGPHLGYTTSGNKQLEPRLVEELKGRKMKHVACGALHTIGELNEVMVCTLLAAVIYYSL